MENPIATFKKTHCVNLRPLSVKRYTYIFFHKFEENYLYLKIKFAQNSTNSLIRKYILLQDNEKAGPSNINLEEDSSDSLRWNIIDESLESTRSCSTFLDSRTLAEDPLNLEAGNSHCVIHINKNIPKTETKTLKLFTQSTLEKCKLISEVRLKMTLKQFV